MLVLRTRVVQVLCSADQRREEHTEGRAGHPFRAGLGQAIAQSVEVDERGEERRHLDIGFRDEDRDEGLERGEGRGGGVGGKVGLGGRVGRREDR